MKDYGLENNSRVAEKELVIPVTTATTQTDKQVFVFTPGHKFVITGVKTFTVSKAGTVTYDVLNGTSVVVNDGAFTADTEVAGTLASSPVGSATDAIKVRYTSDGSGALTGGLVVIRYRVYPLGGDALVGQ